MNKLLSFSLIFAFFTSLNAMENKGKNPVRDDDKEVAELPALTKRARTEKISNRDAVIENPADYITSTATPSGAYEYVSKKTRYPELSPEEKKKCVYQLPLSTTDAFKDFRIEARNIFIRLSKKIMDVRVDSFAVSPDSKYLATTSLFINTVRIIDPTTMQTTHTIPHNAWVGSVMFSPNSKYLATISRTAHIIDLATMQITHEGPVDSAAFSPDSKYLATRSGGTVRIIDLATMQTAYTVMHEGRVDSAAFSPDSKYLATRSDKTAHIIDLATMHIVYAVPNNVNFFAFSPDSKYLATASSDRTARIIDLATRHTVHTETHNAFVRSVAFSPDSKYLATASDDRTVRIADLATMQTVHTVTHEGPVYSVAFSPDSKYLATLSKTTRIIDLATMKTTHNDYAYSFMFSPDSKYLATRYEKIVRIIDLATMQTIHTIRNYSGWITSIEFSRNSHYCVSCTSDEKAYITDLETRNTVTHNDYVNLFTFSPNSQYFVTASNNKSNSNSTISVIDITAAYIVADSMNCNEYELLNALQCAGRKPARIHASPEQWATWQEFREKLPENMQKKLGRLICNQEEKEKEFFNNHPATACNIL